MMSRLTPPVWVLNQYQRRADLIPNLVASIKGYSSHEQEVLEAVTLARSQANRASSDLQQTPGDEQNYKRQQAQAQVSRTLGQLTIISERYPELKGQGTLSKFDGTARRKWKSNCRCARKIY